MKKCELTFVCGKKWDELQDTERATVKYCEDCSKKVFVVKTRKQFSLAVGLGRCVGIADDNNFIGVIGDTAGSMDWMESDSFLRGLARAKSTLTSEQDATLEWLMPKFVKSLQDRPLADDWYVIGDFEASAVDELRTVSSNSIYRWNFAASHFDFMYGVEI
jgi:hypothetical protein